MHLRAGRTTSFAVTSLVALLVLAALALPRVSLAAEEPAAVLDKPAERRAGLVLGMQGGFGLAGSSGFPNKATLINDPAFYSSSDLMIGSGGSFLVMGALTDYLSFGIWLGGGSYQSATWRSSGGGGGFRVEAFPLYGVFPKLRDLGVFTQLGVGSATLETKLPGKYPTADGAQSCIGAGVFYEFSLFKLIGGHVATGPSLEYDAIFARSIERHSALLGGRFIFYGGI